MNFLIDSNILIPLEPASYDDLEANSSLVIDFHRLVSESGNKILRHPIISADLEKDKNSKRKNLRQSLFKKYSPLKSPPNIDEINVLLGNYPEVNSNDWVDHHLLAAVFHQSIDYLVTEDIKIHKKAQKIGISSQVMFLVDVKDFLEELFDKDPELSPAVQMIYAHQLDENNDFFDSLKEDYGHSEFKNWLIKCKREQRICLTINNSLLDSSLLGVCILKNEILDPVNKNESKVLKLCTFKISSKFEGSKYGELLLKSVCDYICLNKYDSCYFTVKIKHEKLILFASDFGFKKYKYHEGLSP